MVPKVTTMTYPHFIRSRARDAILFTIPSLDVITKVMYDSECPDNLRVQAAGRILKNSIRKVDEFLLDTDFEITPVPDRHERLVKLIFHDQPRREQPPAGYGSVPIRLHPSIPTIDRVENYHSRSLVTIPEEEEPDGT